MPKEIDMAPSQVRASAWFLAHDRTPTGERSQVAIARVSEDESSWILSVDRRRPIHSDSVQLASKAR